MKKSNVDTLKFSKTQKLANRNIVHLKNQKSVQFLKIRKWVLLKNPQSTGLQTSIENRRIFSALPATLELSGKIILCRYRFSQYSGSKSIMCISNQCNKNNHVGNRRWIGDVNETNWHICPWVPLFSCTSFADFLQEKFYVAITALK